MSHRDDSAPAAPDAAGRPVVEHDAARSRFRTVVDGEECVADYRLVGTVMQMTHTGVPARLEGRGIAAALVRGALDHAERHGLKIDPRCSYVRGYMQRHAETHHLLA